MAVISTKQLADLPDVHALQRLCKALATLDAVICRDWEYRYYSYNKAWSTAHGEEFFQMRDGSGDEFQILFNQHGAIINGQAHESVMCRWIEKEIPPATFSERVSGLFGRRKTEYVQQIWPGVVDSIPDEFKTFIFGEPVKSIGTTFCVWRKYDDTKWSVGEIKFPDNEYGDGSADLLSILDNNPATYRAWAMDYYEEQFEDRKLKLEWVKHVYALQPMTKEIISHLNPSIDVAQLKADLDEIGYPYNGI